ncbi:MAG: hypothetical protein R3Y23_01810 [Bacillota bacterium]
MDYSSYRVKNLSSPSKVKTGRKIASSKRQRAPKKQKKRSKWGDLIVVTIILMCFATTFILADILSGGGLISTMSIFNNTSYTYYLVTTLEAESKYTAMAESSYIVSTGGAGNLYSIGDNYVVVISAYLDTDSAYSVSQKNDTTQVLAIEIDIPNSVILDAETADYVEILHTSLHSFLYELIDITIALDAGDITSSVALMCLQDTRNSLLTYISEVVENNYTTEVSAMINGILQPLYGGLDAIIYDSDYTYLSGAIRCAIATELIALESIC